MEIFRAMQKYKMHGNRDKTARANRRRMETHRTIAKDREKGRLPKDHKQMIWNAMAWLTTSGAEWKGPLER